MHNPLMATGHELETLTLDPVMDAPTALHCDGCGETLALGQCHNVNCADAGAKASRAGSTRKFERGSIDGPMFSPRAWTMGGRVD